MGTVARRGNYATLVRRDHTDGRAASSVRDLQSSSPPAADALQFAAGVASTAGLPEHAAKQQARPCLRERHRQSLDKLFGAARGDERGG